MRSFLLALMITIFAALTINLLSSNSAVAAPTNVCNAKVVIVGVMGSDQNQAASQALPPFERYGRQAADVAIVLQSRIERANVSYAVDTVAYPGSGIMDLVTGVLVNVSTYASSALGVADWVTGSQTYAPTYSSSRDQGVAALEQLLDTYRNCASGSPKVFLIGYSQGADVIKSFIFNKEQAGDNTYRNQVLGIALIADPRFNALDYSSKLGSYRNAPLAGMTGLLGSRAVPYAYAAKTVSVCNFDDEVCNYEGEIYWSSSVSPHINGYTGQLMVDTGDYLENLLYKYTNALGNNTNWSVYEGNIVRWQDGTSWYVKSDGRRWIPTGGDFQCFKDQGAKVYNLSTTALSKIPDITGSWARCSSSTPSPAPSTSGWNGLGPSYVFTGKNVMLPGVQLYPNQYILTGNAKAYLVLQTDGNLVLYGEKGKALWNSRTAGQKINRAVMQGDGNFVLYRTNGSPAWNSRTSGRSGARLVLQNDGNLVIYSKNNTPLWQTKTNGQIATVPSIAYVDKMVAGNTLYRNQALRSSDKRYILTLQTDGNLVLYSPGYKVLWNSGTQGSGADRAVMQGDGNFVLYKGSVAVWHTGTNGRAGSKLVLQDDGNIVVRDLVEAPAWNSRTSGQL